MTFLLPNDIVYVYSFNSFYCGKVSFVVKKHKMLSEIHYYFKPERKNVMKRRLLAFLMCAVMIIGIFPGAVFAEEGIPGADENTVVVEEPEDKTTEEPKEENDVDPNKPTESNEVSETPETTPDPQNSEGTTEEKDEDSEENQEKSEEEVKTETPAEPEVESEEEVNEIENLFSTLIGNNESDKNAVDGIDTYASQLRVDYQTKSTLTFEIVNGTWNSNKSTTVVFTTYAVKSGKNIVGYVYLCSEDSTSGGDNGAVETLLYNILNSPKNAYTPNNGYNYEDSRAWTVNENGGAISLKTGESTGNTAKAQMEHILKKDSYNSMGNIHNYDTHGKLLYGFKPDTVYKLVLTKPFYKLTVNYVYTDKSEAATSHEENIAFGTDYSVTSPTITGYTPDIAVVSGTMPAQDVTVTVTYSKNIHKLTVNYVYTDKSEAATSHVEDIAFGESYSVTSPTITGYTPDIAVVSGTMPDEDVTVTVVYTKKAEEVKTYKVFYYVDGKLYREFDEKAGDTVDVLAKLRDKTNYTFKGWYLESPKDLPIRFGRFTMPEENVIFYGYYEFDSIDIPIIKDGYIRIEKNLIAPNDFSGSTVFTFDIYKDGNDDDDYYTTVKVAAGDFEKIKVPTGVYYIYEVDAEEAGYTLISASDAQNNRIVVEGGKTRTVTFKNVYTEEAKLETEDHFGYIIGYPDGTVKPQGNITRAEIATIFFRLLTDDARDYYWSQTNDFTDVSADDWFNNAISTLANAGILSGYEDGSFRPNAAITRAELVKIAVSFYDSDAAEDSDFSDVEGHWADMFINAAYGRGFISGYGDGTFKPDQAVTRAEAMKIINRTLDRHPDADHLLRGMITFSDNMDKDAWYYAEVQEATNSHEYEWTSYDLEDWTELLPIRDWAALEKAYSDAYAG